MIYYADLQIVLQEVPGQISLCVCVTCCPLRCKGCDAPFLWKKGTGTPLTDEVFITTLERYKDMISCVLFMGGEWEEEALIHKLQIAHAYGLHTCLYTGLTEEKVPTAIKRELTWLKAGPWIEALGGLSEATTNQRFIEVSTGRILNEMFHHQ